MTKNDDGGKKLLGTIKLNDMVPVPDTEIVEYQLDSETDLNYANLIRDELLFIGKHQTAIAKKARFVYFAKIHEAQNRNDRNGTWFDSILPFEELERLCDLFK